MSAPTVHPKVAHERANLAVAIRDNRDDVEVIRGRLTEAKGEARNDRAIAVLVDAWPPLTDAQLEKLSLLLPGSAGGHDG